MENKNRDIAVIQQEINKQLAIPSVAKSLVEITFKGLKPEVAKRAMLEGMMTGFTFNDFLEKNIYAIPFGSGYSLVSSIDYCRKIGMRSGVVGVSAPKYVDTKEGNPFTCEITVKRKVADTIGEYTALVYFQEYSTGYNQWKQRPRTMIAKVAEMHALRKACPEELSQLYVEEEYERETRKIVEIEEKKEETATAWKDKMTACKTLEELGKVWSDMPGSLKAEKIVEEYKEELKTKLTPKTEVVEGVVE